MPHISKFNWAEVFSNTRSGKTSATAVAGITTIFVGLGAFISGVVACFVSKNLFGTDIILHSLGLVTVGASMLGIRKLSATKSGINVTEDTDIQSVTSDQQSIVNKTDPKV